MNAEENAAWRERIGPLVFLEMVCTHEFDGAVCDICWENTQRICRLLESGALDRPTTDTGDEPK